MKKIDYFWARASLKITGIVFFTQLLLELVGIERNSGFEYTVHICGAIFVCSILYSLVLIIVNAYRTKEK